MARLLVAPELGVLFLQSGCGTVPKVEPVELRSEVAEFDRERCVYPAIWYDHSQVCWEGARN
jgi:hypothetical protein